MARIFRHTYTKSLPEGAEVFTRKGHKYARFKDAKGKMITAPISKDGQKIILETSKWYIDYRNADGAIQRRAGFTDRKATEQLASDLERTAEHIRSGYKPKEHEQLGRPLAEHLKDFKDNLHNKGTTQQHVNLTYNRAKAVIEGCGFKLMADVSASHVQQYLAGLRRQGLSIKSSNYYLQATKQFFNWMVADRRIAENPLAYLKGQNPRIEVLRKRRALTEDELQQLVDASLRGPKHHGMTGEERSMLYYLAVNTGFRAGELASLTWLSFDLDGPEPTVTVLAAYSKRRRDDVQPISRNVAQQFRKWRQKLDADLTAKVFGGFNKANGAKMLRKDLQAAEIPYRDDSGRVADFHAFRHTYISNVSQSGAAPKVSQTLARHSTISLTLDQYTHVALHSERNAVERLPSLKGFDDTTNAAARIKTGTDPFALEMERDNKLDDKLRDGGSQALDIERVTKEDDEFLIRRSQVQVLPGALWSVGDL